MEEVRFLTCGDCAITVAFRQEIREDTNRTIRYLAEKLQTANIHGLLETVPTYCSLTVYYEPLILPRKKLEKLILRQLSSYREDTAGNKRVFEIPVCYEGEFAPDMEDVCRLTGLSREQVNTCMVAQILARYCPKFRKHRRWRRKQHRWFFQKEKKVKW